MAFLLYGLLWVWAPGGVQSQAGTSAPDDADFALVADDESTPDAVDTESENEPGAENLEPNLAVSGTVFVGGSPEQKIDDVLDTLGYERSQLVLGGDVTLLASATEWLWIGGRLGIRYRDWAGTHAEDASAFGPDLLGIAEARLGVNDELFMSFSTGGGLGVVAFRLGGSSLTRLAPRFHLAGVVGYEIEEWAIGIVRLAYDFFTASNFNEYGHDLPLGGVHLAAGLELRQ